MTLFADRLAKLAQLLGTDGKVPAADVTGLGTAATAATTDFDASGAAATAQSAAIAAAATDATTKANAAQAAAIAASQPLDSDLTAIAALSTTSYGRAFLALADAAAGRTALSLGTAATHATGDYDASGAAAAAQAASQPLDSDLTAIAALTTTSYGRSLLEAASAAALRTLAGLGTAAVAATGDFDAAGAAAAAQAASQPLDSDLTAFAGLAIAADKLPYGTGSHTLGLADFTAAGRALVDDAAASDQRTTLGLGTLATQSGTFSGTSSGTNTGDQTIPVGGTPAVVLGTANTAGTSPNFLRRDDTILAFDATTPAAIGTAAVGAATTTARRDHVHASGAGTPSTQAFGDAAATGTGPAAAMTDHKHAMPAALVGTINFIIDGGGSVITTGVKGDVVIDFACAINQVKVIADQSGSIVVDIWKHSYVLDTPPVSGDKITASAPPTLSSHESSLDSTLTGWTTSIAAGDTLRYSVTSATTVQRVTVSLKVTRT